MSRGHNITQCSICFKPYVCGDCITSDCEMGRGRAECPEFKRVIESEKKSQGDLIAMLKAESDRRKLESIVLLAASSIQRVRDWERQPICGEEESEERE